jgi:hypothetical protein
LELKKLPTLYTYDEAEVLSDRSTSAGAGATGPLLLALERRAEAISGEFNSQDVANTLWAYATMGRKPGERLMGQLGRRVDAISGELNSQDVANTLWAYATIMWGESQGSG